MPISSRILAAASVLAVAAAATGALAQAAGGPSAADARVAWAKRHVELVCRPLEAQGKFDKATRCYNDVERLVADNGKPATASPAPRAAAPAETRPAEIRPVRPVVKTAARAAPAVTRPARPVVVAQNDLRPPVVVQAPTMSPRRCSGLSCMQYTLLGVGF